MKHQMTIEYDDETRLAQILNPEVLGDRALCYAMLGLAHEIVTRNGLSAPAFEPENQESAGLRANGAQPTNSRFGVQPVRIKLTDRENDK